MPSISAVLIVKNEAQKLPDCLRSLTWADEIVVLDSGSSDNTCAIAAEFSAKVFVNTDWQGFGVQRERAAQLATGDWIFMIDADERVTSDLQASLLAAVKQAPAIWFVNRLCWCFGRFIKHSG
ncbi:MAG TPA: glycosyltransferase family 2 protein, partial [Cellvibrio sp.]|nr:glycosyltransferase family 2 protein [Cellvibrio sp.]